VSDRIPYLSFSKIDTIWKCGLQAKFRYVDKVPEPASGTFLFGKVIHKVMEVVLKEVQLGKPLPSEYDLCDRLPEVWKGEILEDEKRQGFTGWAWKDGDNLEAARADSVWLVKLVRAEVLPKIKPVLVEHKFNYGLSSARSGPFKVYGVLDLLEEGGRLTDWKTADRNVSDFAKELDLQFPGYSIFAKEYTKQEATECRKVFLIRNGKKPKLDEKPYLILERHRQWFREIAEAAWNAVQGDAWLPARDGSWYCSEKWCPFWAGCKGGLQP